MQNLNLPVEVPMNQLSSFHDYLINEKKGTAIQVPNGVLSTIRNKLRSGEKFVHQALLMSNIISTAIQLKALNNNFHIHKHLNYALNNEVFNGYLTRDEVSDLVEFLADVPKGYKFTDGTRIWAHSEIGSTPTF